MSQSNRSQTISEAIKEDHAELEDYYGRYQRATDDAERTELANRLRWEVASHSRGEELVLHPAMERLMGEQGQSLVAEDVRAHRECREQLSQLEGMEVSDPAFNTILTTLMNDLTVHMRNEERTDLPDLESRCSREESEALARDFRRAKMFVPTRSASSAVGKGLPQTAAALMDAPIDQLRTMLDVLPSAA